MVHCVGLDNAAKQTSCQSDLTKRPHRRRAWTVQPYSPGGVNVHSCLTHASLGQPESILQTASRSLQPFVQSVPILFIGPLLKIARFHGGSGSPSNTRFLEPTRVHNPKGISIGSVDFAGLMIVTDRPTDRPRHSVCNSRPHLRTYSTAMWSNKTTSATNKFGVWP